MSKLLQADSILSIHKDLPFFLHICRAPVHYMPPHPAISTNHLVDHAHLNEEAYTLFAEALWTKLQEMEGHA
jgi:lysophospholipase L1-like esterase